MNLHLSTSLFGSCRGGRAGPAPTDRPAPARGMPEGSKRWLRVHRTATQTLVRTAGDSAHDRGRTRATIVHRTTTETLIGTEEVFTHVPTPEGSKGNNSIA